MREVAYLSLIFTKDHNQTIHRVQVPVNGLIVILRLVLWAELKQTLHLKFGCSGFGPIRDTGSLPYLGM